MQFSIPQFIDTEDRIIGPLTLKQFLWLLGGGGILTAVWMATKNVGIFVIAAIPIGSLFFALAFIKINGRPLITFITNVILYMTRPQGYIWKRMYEQHRESNVVVQKHVRKDSMPKKDFSQSKIAELAWVLDTGGVGKNKNDN